ncbi:MULTISPECIES: tetratricopeptide repeat protein [unclassified Lentimicrobium]|uniref:tetratricopeptide repeat protein n=1 Tax=unclassified Lentimicrobium TaxID=2677434 RepID=UPI0015540092|nr:MULTISPECIES: tetratricopeptide repeat protein [unclassified Lentimicrobium]NPD46539.1 tetratricopeptide repeat protein [Lentimicrobium sp. S6]NPD85188.1 tetratricopeptide repeat protein [Lentimicrobium sp. L6]
MKIRTFLYFNIIFLILLNSCTPPQEKAEKHYEIGRKHLINSDSEAALIEFQKGLEYVPNDALLLYSCGNCYMNFRDYNTAIEYFTKAIENNPKYDDAYFNRGRAWFYLNERDKSCEDYQKAQDLGRPNLADLLKHCK